MVGMGLLLARCRWVSISLGGAFARQLSGLLWVLKNVRGSHSARQYDQWIWNCDPV